MDDPSKIVPLKEGLGANENEGILVADAQRKDRENFSKQKTQQIMAQINQQESGGRPGQSKGSEPKLSKKETLAVL
jgi:hypothetical protein